MKTSVLCLTPLNGKTDEIDDRHYDMDGFQKQPARWIRTESKQLLFSIAPGSSPMIGAVAG